MKIPKKLKIGGHTIKVEFDNVSEMLGSFDPADNTIRICLKQPKSQQEATFIHEIFHVINTTMQGDGHFGHALVDSLAEQFYQVLSDNKLLK